MADDAGEIVRRVVATVGEVGQVLEIVDYVAVSCQTRIEGLGIVGLERPINSI